MEEDPIAEDEYVDKEELEEMEMEAEKLEKGRELEVEETVEAE